MALYWPKAKVALEIVDDPESQPFSGDLSYTVVRVKLADLVDPRHRAQLFKRLTALIGTDTVTGGVPKDEDDTDSDTSSWERDMETFFADEDDHEDDIPDTIQILARNEHEAEIMTARAANAGQQVRGVTIWDGPIPDHSYEVISPFMRMSTPEFFFLRKANELSFPEAVRLGIELCGKYRTKITQYDRAEGYDFLCEPRTSKKRIRKYLRGAHAFKEGKRAERVLRSVVDGCGSPAACYLYLMLCLPKSRGGYELDRAKCATVFEGEATFAPASYGSYLVYDLCWPDEHVAVQYCGDERPNTRDRKALEVEDMRVFCVTNEDMADPHRLDLIARGVAAALDQELPEQTEKWIAARDELRRIIEIPTFENMRLTSLEISSHFE